MNLGRGSYRVHTVHSRQASTFALYRAQGINRGKYRGKGLAFVTSQIRASHGYILLIHRECIGYVLSPTLYLAMYPILHHIPDAPYTRRKPDTSGDASGSMYRAKKSPTGIDTCRACNERRLVIYSVAGVLVNAPKIPAMIMQTRPRNNEPKD